MKALSAKEALEQLRAYVESQGYAGWDPYDALNSRLVRGLCLGGKWSRIAATQGMKRCPINLRKLFGVPKGVNPKALGLFLRGYSRLYALNPEAETMERMRFLAARLEELKSVGFTGHGWGYNFDWQSRAFFLPKGTPTAVNTAFIGHALVEAWKATREEGFLRLAIPAADFLAGGLRRLKGPRGFCFSYTPIDEYAVHNANLLAASLLSRVGKITSRNEQMDLAREAAAYSMHFQREDGSWYYSEWEEARFIDSFHTGFNLEALRLMLEDGTAEDYREGYDKGVRFYREHFFCGDGTPKYYHDKKYPLDIHAAAQAVAFFSRGGREERELARKVVSWTLKHMRSEKGYFYYQRGRWWVNRIPYMRWAQAWAFRALAEYVSS